jgi:hypothetical protein
MHFASDSPGAEEWDVQELIEPRTIRKFDA